MKTGFKPRIRVVALGDSVLRLRFTKKATKSKERRVAMKPSACVSLTGEQLHAYLNQTTLPQG